MSLDLVLGFTQALALTMSVAFVTYVFVIMLATSSVTPAATPGARRESADGADDRADDGLGDVRQVFLEVAVGGANENEVS